MSDKHLQHVLTSFTLEETESLVDAAKESLYSWKRYYDSQIGGLHMDEDHEDVIATRKHIAIAEAALDKLEAYEKRVKAYYV